LARFIKKFSRRKSDRTGINSPFFLYLNVQKYRMQKQDIIVIGASAGSVPTLKTFVASLPPDFQGSIFIVVHIPANSQSVLPDILNKVSSIPAKHPYDGEMIKPGTIYIAPNDHHMIVQSDTISITHGPKENRFRPSIDALFRSAAYTFRERVIGVILSGYMDDGISGLWNIQRMGGTIIIQDPEDTEHPQLPLNVLEHLKVDYQLNGIDLGPIISGLVKKDPPKQKNKFSEDELKLMRNEIIIATKGNAFELGILNMGELTPLTCPECHGSLVKLAEGNILRYRCHTGHAYTASSLLEELTESIEGQLWQSIRGLEETNMLLLSIADQYEKLKNNEASSYFRMRADETLSRSKVIRSSAFQQASYNADSRFTPNQPGD
jgi:two-component system, chemotaxis family, protein-glutamate methylesterase/glutaminase